MIDPVLRGPPAPLVPPADSDVIDSDTWPVDLRGLKKSFLLSNHADKQACQVAAIRSLIRKYGFDRISNQPFEWVQYASGPIKEEWLPIYIYKKGLSLRETWEEWSNGLDGQLSVRQLTEGWDARWRRNVQGQKTEASRRRHIVDLITQLSNKSNWTITLALRFLEEKYPIPGPGYLASPTAFSKKLQNKISGTQTLSEIMDSASMYCR